MNYRKLSSIIYALLIILSIVAPITFIGNVARATITGRPVIQFYDNETKTITPPSQSVVKVPAILSGGDKLIINFSSVDFSTSGAMIWIWFSKEENGGAEIDSEDGVFIGPIKVSDIQSASRRNINVTVYKPFNKVLGNITEIEVGKKMINITELPGMFLYGKKYWVKITDVSPDRGVTIPSSDVSVSTNLIQFETAYYAYSKIKKDTEAIPFEPLTAGAYCAPENKEFNITMDVVKKNWTVKTAKIVEDNYIGGKWEWTGFEFSTSDDASFKAPDLKGAYQSGQPTHYTFRVKIMNQTKLFAKIPFEQPVRKVYLPGDTLDVLRDYSGDYTDLILYTGEKYNITLENFPYDGNVVIKLNKTKVAEIKLLENGSVHNVTIKIPYVAKSGVFNFTVNDGSFIYWFKVKVKIKPKIELKPEEGTVGTKVKVYFHYFSDYVGKRMNIWFQINDENFTLVANFTMTDEIARGDKPVEISVPHATCGKKEVRVYKDKKGLEKSVYSSTLGTDYLAKATFKVKPNLVIVPKEFPADGRIVKVYGTGFCNDWYYVIIDNQFMMYIEANETGDIYIELVATGFQPGYHSLALYRYWDPKYGCSYKPIEKNVTFKIIGTSLNDIEKKLNKMNETLADILQGLKENVTIEIRSLKENLSKLIIIKSGEVVKNITLTSDYSLKVLYTLLGNINITLVDIKNDTVILKSNVGTIKTNICTILKLLSDMNDTLMIINGNVTRLVSVAGSITTNINDLKILITQLGDTIELEIGELGTNLTKVVIKKGDEIVGTLSTKLDTINATIVDVDGKVVTLNTLLGNVKTTVDDLKKGQAEIKDLIKTKSGDIVAVIDTTKGDILAELSTVEDLIKNGVKVDTENILAKIDELKSSVGTASDKLDALAASLDNVKSSLDDVKSSVSAVKSSVEGIKSSVSSAINSAVDDLKTSIEDRANSVSGSVSTYGLVNLILILIAIILTAYVGFFHKKE